MRKIVTFQSKSENLQNLYQIKIKRTFKNIDLILSPAMGGIIIGYEIGRVLRKETIF